MYKEIKIESINGEFLTHIIYTKSDGEYLSFPANKQNTDYQAYIKWLEEGNTPEPAEEV